MTPEAFAALMAIKLAKDIELEQAVAAIIARWKAKDISDADKVLLESPIYDAYNTWALSVGIYDETTVAEDESAEESDLAGIINSMTTSRILKIVTKITNFYRSKQSKSQLTTAEVQSRLMS
jgi:hypothetical protein